MTITHTDHTDHADRAGDLGADGPLGEDSHADLGTRQSGAVGQHGAAAGPEEVPPAAGGAGPQLLLVDPRMLVIGVNTRADAALDKAFVGSIADRGVREPIIARRDSDGVLVVRKGQRRTLAAVQAGLDVVPVVIEAEPIQDEAGRQVDRIVDQLGENQHRASITEADEVAAHQQLLNLGLSAGQIARRTRTPAGRVKTTLRVGGSDLAAAALARYDLSLEQAAVIAEFDEDTDAVTALVAAATTTPGQFQHVAQRARDARTEARLRAELTAQLAGAGVRIIDRPEAGRRSPVRGLDELRSTPKVKPGQPLSTDRHARCPGHVAWLEHSWRADAPLVVTYGCQDWAGHGHAERWADAGQTTTTGGGQAGQAGGAMSVEEKAERREVVANNKAWASATTVRLAWLRQFLARKSAPKDAATWTAITLADGSHDIRRAMEDQHSLARDLLGLGDSEGQRWYRGGGRPHPIAAAAATATPGRAAMLSLAVLLAGLEAGTSKNTWRNPTADNLAYLIALQGWGYELSEVEQVALAHHIDQSGPAGLRGDTREPGTAPSDGPGGGPESGEDGSVGSGGGQEPSDESLPAAADGTAA